MRRIPVPALVLGIALPLVVLVAAWQGLEDGGEPAGVAATFEQRLAQHPPEVVVLGSSLANRGIDLGVLARELGVRRESVVLLQLPHASTAHWYAILKNVVFARGHRPRLVIVAGALTTMLNHDTLTYEGNVTRLVSLLTDDEPALAAKVFRYDDAGDFRLWFVRERAGRWRQDLLDAFRDRVVTWGFARKRKLSEGERLADKVNEQVFANDRMDYGLHRQEATGVGTRLEVAAATGDFELRRDALLPEMQALVDAHDARLVWVRMPFPPSNPTMDVVPDDIEADALAWWEDLGSGYLDMRSMDLDDADFEDMRHLSPSGAIRFTQTLGRTLAAMGVMEGPARVVRGVADVAPPRLSGTPSPPPSPVGVGCRREIVTPSLARLEGGLPVHVTPPLVVRAGGAELPFGAVGPCGGGWWVADGVLVVEAP